MSIAIRVFILSHTIVFRYPNKLSFKEKMLVVRRGSTGERYIFEDRSVEFSIVSGWPDLGYATKSVRKQLWIVFVIVIAPYSCGAIVHGLWDLPGHVCGVRLGRQGNTLKPPARRPHTTTPPLLLTGIKNSTWKISQTLYHYSFRFSLPSCKIPFCKTLHVSSVTLVQHS